MSDPLDILRTHEGAGRGVLWVAVASDVIAPACVPSTFGLEDSCIAEVMGAGLTWEPESIARHIATWDPETTREVVDLLRRVCDEDWGPIDIHLFGRWSDDLDGLLARVRERMGKA